MPDRSVAGGAHLLAALAAALALACSAGCGGSFNPPDSPSDDSVPSAGAGQVDPLRFRRAARREYERRAAAGFAHILFVKSPGGVLATAKRTAAYRASVERTARAADVDPDLLEALVFLESAGRPEVIAGGDPASAAGLTQILAETGTVQLGMNIDLAQSRRLTAQVGRAEREAGTAIDPRRRRRAVQLVARLRARRREVDDRFDPGRALAATGRYLEQARRGFGREDLAFVSYHMGIANLAGVIRDFAGRPGGDPRDIVRDRDLSYTRLYFDSTPLRHPGAYRRLAAFGDESSSYLWRLRAARDIMRLYRRDLAALTGQAALQTAADSSEQVLHPPGRIRVFEGPDDISRAVAAGQLVALPDDPGRTDFGRDPGLGSLAPRLGQERGLYRGLRLEALSALAYLADGVHTIGGDPAPLVVTSAAYDRRYERLLGPGAPAAEGPSGYSLHTTGFAFDIARRYGSRAQALALDFMLERLQALDLAAWIREPAVIHVAAAGDAGQLLALLGRRGGIAGE